MSADPGGRAGNYRPFIRQGLVSICVLLVRPLKVRKRFVHLARTVLLVTLVFMIMSLIFLDILVDVFFFRHWLSDAVLFVIFMMAALTVGFFVFPPDHVILERDGIHVAYPLGRERKVQYPAIKEYKIDDLLQMVELVPKQGKPLEFYYSDPELGDIKTILEQNRVPPAKDGTQPQPQK